MTFRIPFIAFQIWWMAILTVCVSIVIRIPRDMTPIVKQAVAIHTDKVEIIVNPVVTVLTLPSHLTSP